MLRPPEAPGWPRGAAGRTSGADAVQRKGRPARRSPFAPAAESTRDPAPKGLGDRLCGLIGGPPETRGIARRLRSTAERSMIHA